MAEETPVCDFGWKAPSFTLPGTDGKTYSFEQLCGPNGTLVMFICNHCPYVKAVIDRIVRDVNGLKPLGIGAVAICSNDTVHYPDDSFDNMKRFAKAHRFSFPYLIDESQGVARVYGAACTPDFFGFNADLSLQYRGRIYDVRNRQQVPGSKRELYEAMTQIARSGRGPEDQTPSMGCSIKWR